MSIHRSHLTAAALSLGLAGAGVACGGTHAESKTPASATATRTPTRAAVAEAPHSQSPIGSATATEAQEGSADESPNGDRGRQGGDADAELVVSRDVVARCPTLRLVRAHVDEFDQDMLWLAVLESIADCMSEGGPMAQQNIAVSGDEEHRHVIREVLGSRGVSPTRVMARPAATASQGAAECQGGADCSKRVEITIVVP